MAEPPTAASSATSAWRRAARWASSARSRFSAASTPALPAGYRCTRAALASKMPLRSTSRSSACEAATSRPSASSRCFRIRRAAARATMPRAPACSRPATKAIASTRRVLRASRTPPAKKRRSLPALNLSLGMPSTSSSASARSFGVLRASISGRALRPASAAKVLTNSVKGSRSGYPERATRSASSTPDVWSCREMTSSLHESAALASLGLKHRTKCRSDASSTATSSVSCDRNVSMTPRNLVDLNFLPAAGSSCTEKSSCSSALSENCISTTRSPLSGSLFLSSHALVE
mmetsp:Transcript_15728/g.50012  ORF Transcript_15728/g.50012 Transcript_15728/m.50012 type:complete len:291 (+) Transcript_15728:362-1234(+)